MTMTTRYFRGAALLLGMAVLLAGHVTARTQTRTDITGAWTFVVQSDLGPTAATVIFKVDAGKLSGHLSSPMFGEQDLTGTVVDQAFEFSISGDAGSIPFKGQVENGETLKGSFDNPGAGNAGTFSGKRKP